MATAVTATPEVFVRKSSGLVRVMSPSSAFIYNVLTMGLIFPWTYLWAPGALPGGQLVWGILLAMLLEIPIALSYVWLSTAFPRTGGDYVFQSRVFGGGLAFTVVFSGFVIWILQWVALSGWLLATLGFAPLFLGLAAATGNSSLVDISTWFTTPTGIIITSVANALLALVILVSGFRNYIRLQRVMWIAILVSFGTMLLVLVTTPSADVPGKLDAFSAAIGGSAAFTAEATAAAVASGVDLNPAFSLLATLLIAPIAWTSLQWATYSSQQNGEIKSAGSFRDQAYIIVGSLDPHGLPVGPPGVRAGEHGRYAVPLRGRCRLLERGRRGDARGVLPVAQHHRDGPGRQRDRHAVDRLRLHPQRPSDRAQLLHRDDPGHARDVVRSTAPGVGEPRQRSPAHPCERPRHLLPGQHPRDLPVQPVRLRRRGRHGLVGVAHARRDVRLRIRVRGHGTRWSVAPVPGQGRVRSITRAPSTPWVDSPW